MVTIKRNVGKGTQLEIQVNDPKEAVRILSDFSEILSEQNCGACGSEAIRHEQKTVNSFDFYGLKCLACGAQLNFGQHKEGGTLFAKRDKGKRGWYIFTKDQEP